MILSDVVTAMRGVTKAIVTGPQRSGTRIAAKIIASELGLEYIDERRIDFENESRLRAILRDRDGIVVQCPAMSHLCHTLAHDVFVVFVARRISEIVKSQRRVNWNWAEHERRKLAKFASYYLDGDPIAAQKYSVWEQLQRPWIEHDGPARCATLEYDSLREHELWVPAEKRAEFLMHQTTLRP